MRLRFRALTTSNSFSQTSVPRLTLDEDLDCHDATSVGKAMAANGKRKRDVLDDIEEERACKRQKQAVRDPHFT